MLKAIGNEEESCCDSCSVGGLSKTAFRRISSSDAIKKLKQSLQLERDKYLKCHPAFVLFGPESVCSDSLTDHICSQAKFVKVEDDLNFFAEL